MVITITPAPVVNAGVDQNVCQTSPNTILNGSVSGGSTTGQWSGGAGAYDPNNTTLNATYTPTAGEITAGTVTLTLTSTANGTCIAVSDNMVITITPAPVVDAGIDQTVCAATPAVSLNGSVTVGSTTGIWSSSGTGTFSPNNTTLNATYNPSAADIAAGSVTLTLTATNACEPLTDAMIVTITPIPAAPTASGTTICEGNTATLTATAPGGTYEWYDAASGGTLLVTNASYTTPVLAATTTYYVQTTISGCTGPRTAVTVTVNPTPAMTSASSATICSGGTVNIPLTSNVASTYTWIATDNANTTGESTTLQSTGTLSNTITNNTTNVQTVTYTVTPTSIGGSCIA